MKRRELLKAGVAAGAASLLPLHGFAGDSKTVRIGYQKSSALMILLKVEGVLEKKLQPLGFDVSWHEFPNGLPLLEALNVGSLDFTADVADTPPVFALAAGAKLAYVAQEAPSPTAQAIVVKENSNIRTVADLKGKKIAFAKGAGAHYLVISALTRAGLNFKDITPAYLAPADGRAAFERDSVDAWAIWDPFLAAVQRDPEKNQQVRILADGSDGVASYQKYYLASAPFLTSRPKAVEVIYAELVRVGKWTKKQPADAARLLAPIWGLDAATVEAANARRSYDVRPVLSPALKEQQVIADVFYNEGLLPRRVNIADAAVWKFS